LGKGHEGIVRKDDDDTVRVSSRPCPSRPVYTSLHIERWSIFNGTSRRPLPGPLLPASAHLSLPTSHRLRISFSSHHLAWPISLFGSGTSHLPVIHPRFGARTLLTWPLVLLVFSVLRATASPIIAYAPGIRPMIGGLASSSPMNITKPVPSASVASPRSFSKLFPRTPLAGRDAPRFAFAFE